MKPHQWRENSTYKNLWTCFRCGDTFIALTFMPPDTICQPLTASALLTLAAMFFESCPEPMGMCDAIDEAFNMGAFTSSCLWRAKHLWLPFFHPEGPKNADVNTRWWPLKWRSVRLETLWAAALAAERKGD